MALPISTPQDSLTKPINGVHFKMPNQPKQDSRVAYAGPITVEVTGPSSEEVAGESPPLEDIVQPGEDEATVRQELTDRHFTPGEIEISVQILKEPTGRMLSRKIGRSNQKILNAVVQEMEDAEIAKALDIIGYPPEIRTILMAVPQNRLQDIISLTQTRRAKAIATEFGQKYEPKVPLMPLQSQPQLQKPKFTAKNFRVVIDGKSTIMSARGMQEALGKITPRSAKIVHVEEVA